MPENEKVTKPKFNRVSESGIIKFKGMISGQEYNPKLAGQAGIRIYREMSKSDSSVKALLKVLKTPILAADWGIEAGSDEKADIEIANKMRYLMMTRLEFNNLMREFLSMLEYGHSLGELVYQWDNYEGQSLIGLENIYSIKQSTVYAWETSDGKAGITQQTVDKKHDVPLEKLIIFTHEQEGDDPTGESVLRPAYKHWYYANNLYAIDAIANERQGVGIPVAVEPSDASQADKDRIDEILGNMRANEQAFLRLPQGWEFRFDSPNANGNAKALDSADYHTHRMLLGILAQFLDLGSGSGGTQALSKDMTQLFVDSEVYLAKYMASRFQQVLDKLVAINFGKIKNPPKITFSNLGDDSVETIAKSLSELKNAGLITADADLEQSLRTGLKLPKLTDQARKNYDEQLKNPVRPPVPPTDKPKGSDKPDKDDDSEITANEVIDQQREVTRKVIDVLLA